MEELYMTVYDFKNRRVFRLIAHIYLDKTMYHL